MARKEDKILDLAKYLYNEHNIRTPFKMQKILFFIRKEEILSDLSDFEEFNENNNKNFELKESIAFMKNENFEAWINGPVNRIVFDYFKYHFGYGFSIDTSLKESKKIKLDKKYSEFIKKYISINSKELVKKSHIENAWLNARKGLKTSQRSTNKINENDLIENHKH